MNTYWLLKTLHVLSSTILFGTGIGIAFYKWHTDRTGDVHAIRLSSERTVLADWIFTAPAVVIQPLSGYALMLMAGYSLQIPWIACSVVLYLLAGACWLPVVWLQIRMRDLARIADNVGTPLPPAYWAYARTWFWLGVPAFVALVAVYWLMVSKVVA